MEIHPEQIQDSSNSDKQILAVLARLVGVLLVLNDRQNVAPGGVAVCLLNHYGPRVFVISRRVRHIVVASARREYPFPVRAAQQARCVGGGVGASGISW